MEKTNFEPTQDTARNSSDLLRNQDVTSLRSKNVVLLIDLESNDGDDRDHHRGDDRDIEVENVQVNDTNVQQGNYSSVDIEDFEPDFDKFFEKSPNRIVKSTDKSDQMGDFKSFGNQTEDYFSGFSNEIDPEAIPDINIYQHKKTIAQGMMDLALFSANANQLRYVLENPNHFYYYPGIILILISLIFQVLVGIGLILNTRYNVKNKNEICLANKINNFTIIGIFLVTIINIFISAFGVAASSNGDTANLVSREVPKSLNKTV